MAGARAAGWGFGARAFGPQGASRRPGPRLTAPRLCLCQCARPGVQVCIIGAGKMSRLLVKHMSSKGCSKVTVLNRRWERCACCAVAAPGAGRGSGLWSGVTAAGGGGHSLCRSCWPGRHKLGRAAERQQLAPRRPALENSSRAALNPRISLLRSLPRAEALAEEFPEVEFDIHLMGDLMKVSSCRMSTAWSTLWAA